MTELLTNYLMIWRTKEEILNWYKNEYKTKLDERVFRNAVAKFNKQYETGETELFIAHSNKGYILTTDPEIIKKSLLDDYKRGIKLISRNYKCMKALSEKNQLSLTQNDADLYEVLMRMDV